MQPETSNWSAPRVSSPSAWSQPFAEALRRHRYTAGLTQEELAERAGLSVRAVSDLERGVRRAPRRETLQLLADALGLVGAAREAFVTIKRVRSPEHPSADVAAARSSIPRVGDAPGSTYARKTPTGPRQRLPVGRFLGALPEGTLIGREAEMARLRSAVEAVSAGVGQLVLLAGEPGIGKTRLAQELLRVAYDRGFLIASGRCYEQQKGVAYFPFLEALTKAHAAATLALREEVVLRWPEVALLLPDREGEPLAALGSAGVANRQMRLYWQVKGFLQALAQERPVALMVDDFQWADATSLDLLLHLARHTRDLPILLVGAYRDTDVQRHDPLSVALLDLAREQLFVRIDVRPLSAEATRRLVLETMDSAALSDEEIQLLHAHTEGIPFFTLEVLRALQEQRVGAGTDGQMGTGTGSGMGSGVDAGMDTVSGGTRAAQQTIAELAVPGSVRTIIEQRLDHLAEGVREVLREASVLGESFSYAALRTLTYQDEETLDGALDAAVASRLLHEAKDDTFRFHHALIQQTLYMGLPASKRRALHVRAAEALARGPGCSRPVTVAYHFLAAGELARALPFALAAGACAREVYAHAEAEQHYRTALTLAEQLDEKEAATEALQCLGEICAIVGRYDEALDYLERVASVHWRAGDAERQAAVVAQIGRVHACRATVDAGVRRVRQDLQSLAARGLSPSAQASLYLALAHLYKVGNAYAEMLEVAEAARALCLQANDERLLPQAEMRRGCALLMVGRDAEGRRVLERALPLLEQVGDLDLLCHALNNLAVECETQEGDFAAARAYLARAVQAAERLGDFSLLAYMLSRLGTNAFAVGNWSAGQADLERAVQVGEASGGSWATPYPPFNLARLLLARGMREQASRHFEAALACAERIGNRAAQLSIHAHLAEAELLDGDAERARARLEPFWASGNQASEQVTLRPYLGWAYLVLGDEEQAGAVLDAILAQATREGLAAAISNVQRIRALLFARRGEWDAAQEAVSQALALHRAICDVHGEAKALYIAGQIAATRGDAAGAREQLAAALSICDRLGEGLYRPHIARLLATLPA